MSAVSPDAPECAACAGAGKTVYDGGKCSVCRGTGQPPAPPVAEPPSRLARLYEAQQQ